MNLQKKLAELLELFRKRVVLSRQDFIDHVRCSNRSVGRYLKKWGAISSYNFNRRYYVLPGIPQFDEWGLWRYKKFFFSRHGNLQQTVLYIVDRSEAGLTADEISDFIGIRAYTFISHSNIKNNLYREKAKGLYVYYSGDTNHREAQKRARFNRAKVLSTEDLPTDTQAVEIFVMLIKHPKYNVSTLTARVRQQGVKVSTDQVTNLLLYHNLLKKTPDLE